MHVHAVRRRDALQRAQILWMAEHELRRHDAVGEESLLAVDVVQDRVREACTLRNRDLDCGPVVGADHEGCDVELPQTSETRRFVVHVVRHAVLAHHSCRRVDAVLILIGRHGGERRGEALPVRPHGA